MNYLAHLYLAKQSDAAMIGALLGDFVKGNPAGNFPPEIAREILLHRYVDTYTDNHPAFKSALDLFEGKRRRYAGILLDVYYDHMLTLHWAEYSDIQIQVFIERFYSALAQHQANLPDPLPYLAPKMIQQDWLGSYREFSGVELAVNRISTRLSKNGHLLREGLIDLRSHREELAASFNELFPDLIQFAASKRRELL
jgi:acyl carrier protein phosphodiesterase